MKKLLLTALLVLFTTGLWAAHAYPTPYAFYFKTLAGAFSGLPAVNPNVIYYVTCWTDSGYEYYVVMITTFDTDANLKKIFLDWGTAKTAAAEVIEWQNIGNDTGNVYYQKALLQGM